jgi:hypothetical protein
MKFAIACGGTGGHLFPGLAVAEVLRAQGHEVLLFVSEKEVDARALRAHPDLPSKKLPSIGLPSVFSPAMVTFLRRLWESLRKCGTAYDADRPHAVLGMGGFTSIAPLMAARRRGIPAYLHESNVIPGKANRLAARFCRAVLLGFDDCAKHFPKRPTQVTGTPIRRELAANAPTREEARRALGLDPERTTLLVMGGLHHHLVRSGTRTLVSIILETGEAREVHHFSTLIGYGADAINPYIAFDSIAQMIEEEMIAIDFEKAVYNFLKGSIKGVVKTMAKMGISTVASYRGAQIFETIGLGTELVNKFFCGTSSRCEGSDIDQVAEEALLRHRAAFPDRHIDAEDRALDSGGVYQWRSDGEFHLFNPETISAVCFSSLTLPHL